jgi:hypothetical protein
VEYLVTFFNSNRQKYMRQVELEMILSGKVRKQTDDAVLIVEEETEFVEGWEEWFPKSQCEQLQDVCVGEQVDFECPDWLAKKKGF